MSTAQFAAFSDNAIMFASIVYVLAFLAHLVEWVFLRSLPVQATVEEPALVRPPAPSCQALTSPGRRHRLTTSADVEERELRVETWGRIGLALTVLGCALHFLGLVSRGLASDPVRVPWGNMYEFTLAGTFGVSVMYLALMKRYHLRWMGVVVTGFLVVVLMLDQLVLYTDAGPLVPALHSYWLVIHVLAAVVASGAFAVGALALGLFLVKDRATRRGRLRPGGYLSRLPSVESLERVGYRVNAFGFPIWTFAALVAGPDLGGVRLGQLLELGPQGGVGVHHLGDLRRLPARPGDRRLEGQGRGGDRAGRVRLAAVQLRGDQLLLRRRQPALLRRRLRPRAAGQSFGRLVLVAPAAVEPAQEVLVVVGRDRARRRLRRGTSTGRGRTAAPTALDQPEDGVDEGREHDHDQQELTHDFRVGTSSRARHGKSRKATTTLTG